MKTAKNHTSNPMEKRMSWSKSLARTHGKIAAQQFATGAPAFLRYIDEDITRLSNMAPGATLADIPDSILAPHLPSFWRNKYNIAFLEQLFNAAQVLRERFCRGDVSTKTVADEVILRGIATCGVTHFDAQRDATGCDQADEHLSISWIYDIAEDEEVEMLFDEEPVELDPYDDYYYVVEHWFLDYYQPRPGSHEFLCDLKAMEHGDQQD